MLDVQFMPLSFTGDCGSDLDVGSSSILGRGRLSGLVRAGCMAVGDLKSICLFWL
jgi:hypothetical protein